MIYSSYYYFLFYFIVKFIIKEERENYDRRIEGRLIYYRTDGFQDAVLVKDVGVSCNLLNKNTVKSDISISGVENYLIKQLKLEYNELSNITRKLNMYIKDILNNLLLRCRRKEQFHEKLV